MVKATHTAHNSKNVIVGSIDTYLGSLGSFNGGVGKNKLEGSIVNAREVACSAGLMLFRSQSE
jgi:hypothetical protein